MLNMCILSVVMIFCVFGIYFFVKEIMRCFLKNTAVSRIIVEIHEEHISDIEGLIRSALSANPQSIVTIINKSDNNEVKTILQKLSKDTDRIHIETAPKK